MKATTTLPQATEPYSSDFRLALRAVVSLQESHAVAPMPDGNCWAHDLVKRWRRLTGEPMPLNILRQELRLYRFGEAPDYLTECGQQRWADEELAEGLVYGDVRLVPQRKRARR